MKTPEDIFQTFILVPKAKWISSEEMVDETDGDSTSASLIVGDEFGQCVAKWGRYHLFAKKGGTDSKLWMVDTKTREVRIVNRKYKRQELKGIFKFNDVTF